MFSVLAQIQCRKCVSIFGKPFPHNIAQIRDVLAKYAGMQEIRQNAGFHAQLRDY